MSSFTMVVYYHFALEKKKPYFNRKQTKSLSLYKEVVHFVSENGTPLCNFAEHL